MPEPNPDDILLSFGICGLGFDFAEAIEEAFGSLVEDDDGG